jgi:HPt (histidine-containing phosphotransfer) domain-containing protein
MTATTVCDPPSSVFNRYTSLERMGGDERLLHDLAEFYVEDAPSLCRQLTEALQRGDADEVTRSAHSLKALSANFDAHAACAIAQLVERTSGSGNLTAVRPLLATLSTTVEALIAGLRAEFDLAAKP